MMGIIKSTTITQGLSFCKMVSASRPLHAARTRYPSPSSHRATCALGRRIVVDEEDRRRKILSHGVTRRPLITCLRSSTSATTNRTWT
jgi:hypothetical protein